MSVLDNIRPYAKAVVAFVAPGVVALGQAVLDSSPGGEHITGPEWIGIVVAMFVTSGIVYAVPNRPKPDPAPDGPANPGDPQAASTDEGGEIPPDPSVDPGDGSDAVGVIDPDPKRTGMPYWRVP